MTTRTITALMVAPGMHPCVIELYRDVDFLRQAISIGLDFPCPMSFLAVDSNAVVLYNPEGNTRCAKCNRIVEGRVIAGVFYIVGVDGSKLVSLSPDAVSHFKAKFWEPEEFSDAESIDAFLAELNF